MKTYLKEICFPSPIPSYIKDITPVVNDAIKKSNEQQGLVVVRSNHTTLGLFVNELAERKLLADIVNFSKDLVGEDPRSTWVAGQNYQHPLRDYLHACMDSPLRPPDEMDEDFNAARHIRALLFAQPQLALPFQAGSLVLGRYQQLAVMEFDGRDGTNQNPLRQRMIQAWIYPTSEVVRL